MLLALLVPRAAASQECGDRPTQAEMNRCAAAEFARVDAALTKAYDEYRSRLNEDQERRLGDAQRAWRRFRDLWCGFESSAVVGGSAHPFVRHSCLAEVTRARLRQLSVAAVCEEGDLSCPAPR